MITRKDALAVVNCFTELENTLTEDGELLLRQALSKVLGILQMTNQRVTVPVEHFGEKIQERLLRDPSWRNPLVVETEIDLEEWE